MSPSVVVAWPSINAKEADDCATYWKSQGYDNMVVLMEEGQEKPSIPNRVVYQSKWEGFAHAANLLCHSCDEDIVVLIGNDMRPDFNHTPEQIADGFLFQFPDLYGVMQPTGDKYGSIESCAVSPWIGRAYIEESYGGIGPYWPEYFHYFSDEELQSAATLQNAFVQRSDLSQYHDHWERNKQQRPEHLMKSLRMHSIDRKRFNKRKLHNFPGHERCLKED